MSGFEFSRFKRRTLIHPTVKSFQKYLSIFLIIKACISYLIDVGRLFPIYVLKLKEVISQNLHVTFPWQLLPISK